jgi:DNA-binding MarR family transcriptional regulator
MSDSPDPELCAEAARVCGCFNLRRTARAVTRFYDECLQQSGLRSTQFLILVTIQAEGTPTLPRLARVLDLDRSVVTRNLRPLERDGLVRTIATQSRATTVELTPKGLKKLSDTLPLWEQAQGRLVDRMGKRRWSALIDDLSDVHRAAHEG